jgi:transcriptional regulator with XRE-family HTH domain
MLRDKITNLLRIKNETIKQLALAIGISEPSIYRWFNEDSMEIKHLRKIADYFGKDISYFFDIKEIKQGIDIAHQQKIQEVKESRMPYGIDLKDKYIKILEELSQLHKENAELKNKLVWYLENCECDKRSEAG